MIIEDNIKNLVNIETPGYIFDLNILKENIRGMRESIQRDTLICYAMKANPFVVKYLSDKVDRLEVCSPGEYEICIRENIEPDKIVVSGVNKTEDSIDRIFEYSKGKGIYTIESMKHFEILSKCASEKKYKIEVIIRLTSGNQFGVDKVLFEELVEKIVKDDNLELLGLHYYSGTQKKISKIQKEIKELDEYVGYIKDKYGLEYFELEYGPGLLVPYFQDSKVQESKEQLRELNIILKNIKNYDKTILEFGRFITANAGYYLTKINDVKNTDETGYIIVDGGIHQINYYGQVMGMKKPFMSIIDTEGNVDIIEDDEGVLKWNICGSLCTVNDVIVRGVCIDNPKKDDILVFENVGAYSVTEGMALFLSRELPQVSLYNEDGKIDIVRNKYELYNLNSIGLDR